MHPCCGGSLQTGTKVAAIVIMVLAIIVIILGSVGTASVVEMKRNYDNKVERGGTSNPLDFVYAAAYPFLLAEYIILIVGGIINLLFAVLLIVGAVKRNRNMCMVWFVFMAFNLGFDTITMLLQMSQNPGYFTLLRCGGILLDFYFMWIVWGFMSELKRDREQQPITQN